MLPTNAGSTPPEVAGTPSEFYDDSSLLGGAGSDGHLETFHGGLVSIPGVNELVMVQMNPLATYHAAGFRWVSTTSGADFRNYTLNQNPNSTAQMIHFAEAHPDILPRSFDVDEFRTDVALVEGLYSLRHAGETLFRRIDDTYFAAGSEAYAAALVVYQYAKVHNLASGALEETLDDLGRRFARKGKRSDATP